MWWGPVGRHHSGMTHVSHPRTTLGAAVVALGLLAAACGDGSDSGARAGGSDAPPTTSTTTVASAAGGEFTIGPVPADRTALAATFGKHVDVWGITIVATDSTSDAKVLHAANVMAQYLDNDADGVVDDPRVLDSMIANRATLVMAATPDEFEALDGLDAVFDEIGAGGQDLYGSETAPAGGFDASLEEVHHLILNTGWSQVFPDELGQTAGSAIADAMDIARGGVFTEVPDRYPEAAWYTYDDRTCDYTCMITEYTYWAHTSLLGGQVGRADEIGHEWRLETPEKVRDDVAAVAVLTADGLGLPTVLPDGDYQG